MGEQGVDRVLDFWKSILNGLDSLAQGLGIDRKEACMLLFLWELRAIHEHLEVLQKLLSKEDSGNEEPSK